MFEHLDKLFDPLTFEDKMGILMGIFIVLLFVKFWKTTKTHIRKNAHLNAQFRRIAWEDIY